MEDKTEAPGSPKTKKMINGDRCSSAAGLSASRCTNLWCMTHCLLGTEASLLELGRFMALGGLGFPDSPNTTGWPPLLFKGLAPMDQLSKSRTKNNLQAKRRTPHMPLAADHWFSEGSKTLSQ